jgi:hypothetical protein
MNLRSFTDWVGDTGKRWLFRAAAFALTLFAALSSLDIINKNVVKPEFIYPAIFLLLWLMFEILLSVLSSVPPSDRRDVAIIAWSEAIPPIINAVRRTKHTLRILGSSSESMFIPLKECLERLTDVDIQLLLRRAEPTDVARMTKLTQYCQYWNELNSAERHVKVEVRLNNNDVLRGIIVDHSEALLGFYEWRGRKLWGHSVPLMHVRRSTPLGDHLIQIYTNRFEQMWSQSSPRPAAESPKHEQTLEHSA